MQTDWLPNCRLLHYIHLPVLYCTCVLHYTLHHLKKECEKEHRNPSRTCTFECQLFSRHISNNKYITRKVHPVARVAMAASAPILLLKRENQPRLEYMPVSSPTKCIACSLDTYRGALYPIIFVFYCIFAFISTLKDTWLRKSSQIHLRQEISL